LKTEQETTIYDIARALEISASTVSRALNDSPSVKNETKKKIQEQARKMNYQQNSFASNLRRKTSNTIGVIIPRLDSYFLSSVISGIEPVLNKEGYNLIISQSLESFVKEKAAINTMFNSRIDGLLISHSDETTGTKHLNLLLKKNIPVVFFDRLLDYPNSIGIVIDNVKASYEVTSHLIEQGCRKIVHFTGNSKASVYKDRHEGYTKALLEHGIEYDSKLVFDHKLTNANIEMVLDKIASREIEPDGLFTSNDQSAVIFICRLKELGFRIPQDIAVAGFNNNPISKVVEPNLTTVDYPGEEIGIAAANALISRIKNKSYSAVSLSVLSHKLIVRNSTLKRNAGL